MASNGSLEEIKETRAKVKLIEARLRLDALERVEKRQKRLLEYEDAWDWIDGYGDVLDRMRGDGFDRDFVAPVSVAQDRRYGAYWPFWRTWLEHARLRAAARTLYGLSTLAQGALRGLCNYVIDQGYVYRVTALPGQQPPPALVGAVQATLDDFDVANTAGQLERECFIRDRRDGEFALRDFPQDDGMLLVRTVDPTQIVEPANCQQQTDSFGIITDAEDLETVEAYSVSYDGNSATAEDVPADQITYHKCNVDRIVKRGLTDLCFDTYDTIKSGQKLIEALSEGSAIQASIALLRQHDSSVAGEVSGFVDSVSTPQGGRGQHQKFRPGTILDAPKGMEHVVPPFASNAQGFVTVVQAVLRSVAVKWNAPEWLISGDASNNNYSSSITAESPFVKSCKAAQGDYQVPFLALRWKAVKAKCEAGRMRADGRTWSYEEVRRLIDIQCEPPTIEVRDKAGEAGVNTQYMTGGIKSPQTICQEQGLDYEQEMQNLEEHNERFGARGDPVPGPGDVSDSDLAGALGGAGAGSGGGQGNEGAAGALRATVGGSQAIAALQTSYYAGELPREAAVANAVIVFGFDETLAARLFPAVAPVKLAPADPAPEPTPPADPMPLGESFTGIDAHGHKWIDGHQVPVDKAATGGHSSPLVHAIAQHIASAGIKPKDLSKPDVALSVKRAISDKFPGATTTHIKQAAAELGKAKGKPAPQPAEGPPAPKVPAPSVHDFARAFVDADAARGGHNHVSLVALKKRPPFSEMTMGEYHDAIQGLRKEGVVTMSNAEGRHGTTPEEQAHIMRDGDDRLLFVSVRDPEKVKALAAEKR